MQKYLQVYLIVVLKDILLAETEVLNTLIL